MMKKYFLLLAIGLYACVASAQLIKQESQSPKKQADLDWYNCSFEEDGVYGAEINKAYEFLKGKKIKKAKTERLEDNLENDTESVLWNWDKETGVCSVRMPDKGIDEQIMIIFK